MPFSIDFPGEEPFFLRLIEREDEAFAFLNLKEEAELSFLCDRSLIQDAFRMRTARRARLLAQMIIDDKGEIVKEKAAYLAERWQKAGYIAYPNGENDGLLTRHHLGLLKRIVSDEAFCKMIKKFHYPLCHEGAEQLIRHTLNLPPTKTISEADIRRAVLSACFTLLRQNVGSCFATAPAILIHEEQMDWFLSDLYELLTTGKLSRTFGGNAFSVPLSPSSGIGDLGRSILLIDPRASIYYSPGLLATCEAIGLIDKQKPLLEKIEQLKELLEPYLKQNISVEALLRKLLLSHFDLSEQDVEECERMEKSAAMFDRRMGITMQISQKRQRYEQMKEKEKEAKSAFKMIVDNALLKAWEFTLASFSDIKMDFSRWNLFTSLGFHHEEAGGIGQVVYRHLEEKLKDYNQKIQRYQIEYEIAYDQVRATETLLRQAATESDIRRLRAEHQGRLYHMRVCLEIRDEAHGFASNYSSFYNFLFKEYEKYFAQYFQEIYDPEMQEPGIGVYDDSPAGFRLIYKHGRTDPSLWELIYGPEQYIANLVDFFLSTEQQIASDCEWEQGRGQLVELTSLIVIHLRSQEFLETSLQRMEKYHRGQIIKKPWAYTSGGTMNTLLKTYFKNERELKTESKWVESQLELAVFIIDSVKHLPHLITDAFLKNPQKGMLMQSPTHAFVLHPGWDSFKEAWQDDTFTYSYVRDHLLDPVKRFYIHISLDPAEQRYLIDEFADELPIDIAHRIRRYFSYAERSLSVTEFREMLSSVFNDPTATAAIDAFLFQTLPLTSGSNWKQEVSRLLEGKHDSAIDDFADYVGPFISSKKLKKLAKECFLLSQNSVVTEIDLHRYIAGRASHCGLAPPAPFLFADTNWPNYSFAFLVNPGTLSLELWRMNTTGTEGLPMREWDIWLSGSKKIPWLIYTHPYEYTL